MTRLSPIAADLWELAHRIRLPGGIWFPLRTTVWRLPHRQLVLHSPVPLDDAAVAELAAIGDVAHLVAPSRLHHLYVEAAAKRYPDAAVWCAPGVSEKHPGLKISGELGNHAPAPWRDLVDQVLIEGAPRVNEVVFHHRASRTLVCTDLVFHITRPANWRTRLALRVVGAGGGRLAASRAWRFFVKQRALAADAVARVLAWDLERIVMAHGDVFEGDARTALVGALPRVAGRRALPTRSSDPEPRPSLDRRCS